MDVVSFINSLPSARPLHLNQQLACPLCLGCVWLLENVFWKIHIFRRRKMFPWCLVAFQKIFRKIFSGVWKRRRKTQIQKNTSHNPGKNHQRRHWTPSDNRAVIAIQDRDQRRDREIAIDGEIAIFARSRRQSRSRSGREIAINGVARSQIGDRDQRRRDRGLEIASNDNEIAIARARSLSLFLSLSENTLKGK